jgi:hypothetical protein
VPRAPAGQAAGSVFALSALLLWLNLIVGHAQIDSAWRRLT